MFVCYTWIEYIQTEQQRVHEQIYGAQSDSALWAIDYIITIRLLCIALIRVQLQANAMEPSEMLANSNPGIPHDQDEIRTVSKIRKKNYLKWSDLIVSRYKWDMFTCAVHTNRDSKLKYERSKGIKYKLFRGVNAWIQFIYQWGAFLCGSICWCLLDTSILNKHSK